MSTASHYIDEAEYGAEVRRQNQLFEPYNWAARFVHWRFLAWMMQNRDAGWYMAVHDQYLVGIYGPYKSYGAARHASCLLAPTANARIDHLWDTPPGVHDTRSPKQRFLK